MIVLVLQPLLLHSYVCKQVEASRSDRPTRPGVRLCTAHGLSRSYLRADDDKHVRALPSLQRLLTAAQAAVLDTHPPVDVDDAHITVAHALLSVNSRGNAHSRSSGEDF